MATPEALVGALLAFLAVASALTLTRGLIRLGAVAATRSESALARSWALDRVVREVARAGIGVCPDAACADEPVEYFGPAVLGVRGDLDADDPENARDPERTLGPGGAPVATGNDEVVLYLARGAGATSASAVFDADLDSTDRVTLPDGTLLARRDGVVEPIDAGPFSTATDLHDGTMYRVTFIHDARASGTSRFRVVEPLADGITRFEVAAFDVAGAPVASCGGGDDAAGRECRARIARVRLTLCGVASREEDACSHREVALDGRAGR